MSIFHSFSKCTYFQAFRKSTQRTRQPRATQSKLSLVVAPIYATVLAYATSYSAAPLCLPLVCAYPSTRVSSSCLLLC